MHIDNVNENVYNILVWGDCMSISEQLKILCIKLNISAAELARNSGRSPQSLSQKMKRGSFTVDELKQISEASGCRFVGTFILPNGDKVEY